jgi:Ca2+-binding RTX toxin-like protein
VDRAVPHFRRALPGLLVVTASLVAAAPAPASTVSRSREDPDDAYSIYVANTNKDQNDLVLTRHKGYIVVHERGYADLRTGEGCSTHAPKEVWCPFADTTGVYLNLAGGEDRLNVSLPRKLPDPTFFEVQVFGGSGRDRISVRGPHALVFGDSGSDVIKGGGSDDELQGGPGRDRLYGRRGNDRLDGDGTEYRPEDTRADDLLDGGPGRDNVTWQLRSTPVVADLRLGRGGGAGERDALRSIENLQGGSGPDVLRGDARRNLLRGESGSDVLVGRAGDDLIDAAESSPDPRALPGTDRVRCGAGFDVVRYAARDDRVAADCEWRTWSGR